MEIVAPDCSCTGTCSGPTQMHVPPVSAVKRPAWVKLPWLAVKAEKAMDAALVPVGPLATMVTAWRA
jgi:hypothetical protein